MKNSARMETVREMEGAALAMIARDGPITRYGVKEGFRRSPSEFWSGSAGAVYPLVRRLEERGFIASSADKADQRGRRLLKITPAGTAALTSWLMDAERASGIGFDPLRTRLYFSELLTPAQLRKFLRQTEAYLAFDSAPPKPHSPQTVALHRIWEKFRRNALRAYTKSTVEKDRKKTS